MRLLFWNVRGNPVSEYVARCAIEHESDIVCLAEHGAVSPNDLCHALRGRYKWVNRAMGCDCIRVFAKDNIDVHEVFEQDRFVICSLRFHAEQYVLAATHLPDRHNHPEPDLRNRCIRRMMVEVADHERATGCNDSIVIGDLNADPYDPELTQLDTFNATPFKEVAMRAPSRLSEGEAFRVMYNPTRLSLGEEPRNYGSFYWSQDQRAMRWHCLDQVLVSASLANKVSNVSYLRNIGDEGLIASVAPIGRISDHLPLLVSIEGEDSA